MEYLFNSLRVSFGSRQRVRGSVPDREGNAQKSGGMTPPDYWGKWQPSSLRWETQCQEPGKESGLRDHG